MHNMNTYTCTNFRGNIAHSAGGCNQVPNHVYLNSQTNSL